MKLIKLPLLCCLVFILLTACAPAVKVTSEPSGNFSLSNYQTFSFYDVDVDATEDIMPSEYQQAISYIKSEIAQHLKQRGLTQASFQPDLLINLGIVVDEQVQTRETSILTDPPTYIGQRRYTWKSREVEVGRYKEGTVSVHLVDNSQNELIWRGTAESILPSDRTKLKERITEGMQKLISRIPQ